MLQVEGRGFGFRRDNFFFNGYTRNFSSRITALGSTEPLTEMNTRNLPGGKGRPAPKADSLTTVCEPIV
jgi:hypothetical protein